jgi:hypothetical protein
LIAINIPLVYQGILLYPTGFGIFPFSLFQDILQSPSWFFFLFIGCSRVGCLISTHFYSFQTFSSCWFLVLLHCSWKRYLIWFQFLKIYWDLFCGLLYDLSWRLFLCSREECIFWMYILFNILFCLANRMPVRSMWSRVQFSSCFFLNDFLFSWFVHYWKWGVQVPYCYCFGVYFSFYAWYYLLILLGVFTLGAYIFKIVISSCWIDSLSLYNDLSYLFLPLLI